MTGSRLPSARQVAEVVAGVGVLWAFAGAGDLVAGAAGVAVPGSVLGMLALWAALESGVVRLAWIDGGARLLLAVLGLLFVPAGAGFVQFLGAGTRWLEVGAVLVVGCLLSLGVSARVVQRGVAGRG
jgi:holin-like protein